MLPETVVFGDTDVSVEKKTLFDESMNQDAIAQLWLPPAELGPHWSTGWMMASWVVGSKSMKKKTVWLEALVGALGTCHWPSMRTKSVTTLPVALALSRSTQPLVSGKMLLGLPLG